MVALIIALFLIVIAIYIFVILAFSIIVIMTFLYQFFYVIIPLIAGIVILAGLLVGLWNAIKNTVTVINDVYK